MKTKEPKKVPKSLVIDNSLGFRLTESKQDVKHRDQNLTKYRCVLGRQIPELNLAFPVKYSWMLSRNIMLL